MSRLIDKLSLVLIKKLTKFGQRLLARLTPAKALTQKQIDWFIETLRELGLGIMVGVILNLSLNQINLTKTIWLLISTSIAWYISYNLIQINDRKN